jgi:hypothetical protein
MKVRPCFWCAPFAPRPPEVADLACATEEEEEEENGNCNSDKSLVHHKKHRFFFFLFGVVEKMQPAQNPPSSGFFLAEGVLCSRLKFLGVSKKTWGVCVCVFTQYTCSPHTCVFGVEEICDERCDQANDDTHARGDDGVLPVPGGRRFRGLARGVGLPGALFNCAADRQIPRSAGHEHSDRNQCGHQCTDEMCEDAVGAHKTPEFMAGFKPRPVGAAVA